MISHYVLESWLNPEVPVTKRAAYARLWSSSTGEQILTQEVTLHSAEVHTTFCYCKETRIWSCITADVRSMLAMKYG